VVGSLTERWATVEGIRTRYFEAGRDRKKCVIFVHGLGSSGDRWLDIPLALSFHYRTIAIDLPGFGMSDKPSSGMRYTIKEYAEFIKNLMDKLEISDGRTSLVGHSLGGYISAEVAVLYGHLVDRLVLIDTSGMLNGPTPLLEQYLEAAMNPTPQAVRRVFEQLVANPVRIPEVLVTGFIQRMGLEGAKNAFRLAYENSVRTQIGEKRLGQISHKTLIIWGRQDRLIPLEYSSAFERSIKGSRTELIEDAGHAPFAEKPALASEILRQFLG
jgi:pimeloyl-ACP methyl ester carboxylesterase